MPLFLDFDDFCFGNTKWKSLLQLREFLPRIRITLFTIVGRCEPEWLGKLIRENADWLDFVPHGWLHYTNRECEHWSYEDSLAYLHKIKPWGMTKGFKAPGWQISAGMYRALLHEGYWVADQSYNDKRRPVGLVAYLLDSPDKIHGHIGHLDGHNENEIDNISDLILQRGSHDQFGFIRDLMSEGNHATL